MSATNEDYFFKGRKSDVFSPQFSYSRLNNQWSGEYRGQINAIYEKRFEIHSEKKKSRGGSSSEDLSQLKLPDKNSKQYSREEMNISVASSAYLLFSAKSVVTWALFAIKIASILQIIGFGLQITLFGILLAHTDESCRFTFALEVAIGAAACFGLLMGAWNIFSNFLNCAKKCIRTAVIGTIIAVLNLMIVLVFVFYQQEHPLSQCVAYRPHFLFGYKAIAGTLIGTLVVEFVNVILVWKAISDQEKIRNLEQDENRRASLISRVARDLSVV